MSTADLFLELGVPPQEESDNWVLFLGETGDPCCGRSGALKGVGGACQALESTLSSQSCPLHLPMVRIPAVLEVWALGVAADCRGDRKPRRLYGLSRTVLSQEPQAATRSPTWVQAAGR